MRHSDHEGPTTLTGTSGIQLRILGGDGHKNISFSQVVVSRMQQFEDMVWKES